MTKHTQEFLALFESNYGYHYQNIKPDHYRCCQAVYGYGAWHQCSRRNGHGPHGAYCRQHDPEAVEKRRAAELDKMRDEAEARKAEAKARKLREEFKAACIQAIRDIAAGHNDPRGLAQSIIEKDPGYA